jgi:hypothetical protein
MKPTKEPMHKYRVRSRVLFDVEHVVEAVDHNHAKIVAETAAELALKRGLPLITWSDPGPDFVVRHAHDGMVVCQEGPWVDIRLMDTDGLRGVIVFKRHAQACDGFSNRETEELCDRLAACGHVVRDYWMDDPSTLAVRVATPLALTKATIERLVAPVRHDLAPEHVLYVSI